MDLTYSIDINKVGNTVKILVNPKDYKEVRTLNLECKTDGDIKIKYLKQLLTWYAIYLVSAGGILVLMNI